MSRTLVMRSVCNAFHGFTKLTEPMMSFPLKPNGQV